MSPLHAHVPYALSNNSTAHMLVKGSQSVSDCSHLYGQGRHACSQKRVPRPLRDAYTKYDLSTQGMYIRYTHR